MRERVFRMALWTAVVLLMAAIFAFSAQPGQESEAITKAAAMPLAELITELRSGTGEGVMQAYHIIGTIMRKTAHVLEYALLGALLQLLCRCYGISNGWLAMAIGVAYAATDEIHQAYVPGRLGTPVDVLIDAIGVIIGIGIIMTINKIRRHQHVHDQ